MSRRIAYLPGDGIGPEVLGAARNVLQAAGFQAEWVELPIGWERWREAGDPLPLETLDALRTTEAAFLGAVTSKSDPDAERELVPHLRGRGLRYRSPIVRLRRELDLGVNVRPVRSFPGNPRALHEGVDLVIFRENTEGLYAGVEARAFPEEVRAAWLHADPSAPLPPSGPDTAVTLRVITRRRTERLMRAAFEYGRTHGRRKVTLVEKPNIMRATGGLMREIFFETARNYPDLEAEDLNVDAACARIVRRPQDFDVLVAANLLGDILSDVAAEVAGGLPIAASANLGERYALFEPVHGSAPDIAGQGVANPLGAVLAGSMLARHVGAAKVADRVDRAVQDYVGDAQRLPRDLGGDGGTAEVEEALVRRAGGIHGRVAWLI